MPMFGSHLSIAGGYYKAVAAAAELGFDCVQLFTKNNNQWQGKPITPAEAEKFKATLCATKIQSPISHDSYLINLGSPADDLWRRSIAALAEELRRAALLGIDHVVAHPGAHMGQGEDGGLARVAAGLRAVIAETADLSTTIALETTAGQGTNLGWRFEHLGSLLDQCDRSERLTACLDTCHVFAAGYALAPKRAFNQSMKEFDAHIGFDRLVAVHLNDSKKGLGSRVDRHEHIGKGELGIEPFDLLVNDRRFRRVPLILETAKEDDPTTGKPWDAINLGVLQDLVK